MKDQPEINIGMIGHVDHGKTTLTERLSGKWTDTHSEELKRGITIRLGYADSTFWKVTDGKKVTYVASEKKPTGKKVEFLRKVSFVDAPGHESLMATMLAGATIIDGAILMVAANEECPQPQTREHLMALEILGVENVIIVQNKIDLVNKEIAMKNYEQIKALVKDTAFKDAPIVPISAQQGVNITALIEALEKHIPTPKRDEKHDPVMFIARSFDINKPGSEIKAMKGGVLGGSIKAGHLKVGQEIEIRPGYMVEEKNQKIYKPIMTTITSVMTGGKPVKEVHPGGSIAILTELDPNITRSDKLTGSVVGLVGKLPDVRSKVQLEIHLLERVVGAKEDISVDQIKKGEVLMLNVNSAATVGMVTELKKDIVACQLKLPVCCELGARISISRRIGNRFRLIGYGILKA